jgi:hypothetical protein
MNSRYQKHTWQAGACRFVMVLGQSTYSVAVLDSAGNRIRWTGRKWGLSLTDALSAACYVGDARKADSAIWYLFANILRGCTACPGITDLWRAAVYIGEPACVADRARRLNHEAWRARYHEKRFSGGWQAFDASRDYIGESSNG